MIRLPFIMHTSLGHEIAHCWWGNGVYVDYEKGNWSEGLTTYVADYLYKERASLGQAREYRLRSGKPSETCSERGYFKRRPGTIFKGPLNAIASVHLGDSLTSGCLKKGLLNYLWNAFILSTRIIGGG